MTRWKFMIYLTFFSFFPLIAKEETKEFPQKDFFSKVDPNQKEVISEIIITMGSYSLIALGLKKSHLTHLGKKLHDVPPLQFLGWIFSNPSLRKHMRSIRKSSFKWHGFLKGLKPGLEALYHSKTRKEELLRFAHFLSVPAAPLIEKADKQDWQGFVEFLIKEKAPSISTKKS